MYPQRSIRMFQHGPESAEWGGSQGKGRGRGQGRGQGRADDDDEEDADRPASALPVPPELTQQLHLVWNAMAMGHAAGGDYLRAVALFNKIVDGSVKVGVLWVGAGVGRALSVPPI